MEHVVKLQPRAFALVASGEQKSLIFKASKDVQEADLLRLVEIDQITKQQTGKEIYASAVTVSRVSQPSPLAGSLEIQIELIE